MRALLLSCIAVGMVSCRNIGYQRVPGSKYGAPPPSTRYGPPSSGYVTPAVVPGTDYGAPVSPVHGGQGVRQQVHGGGQFPHGRLGTVALAAANRPSYYLSWEHPPLNSYTWDEADHRCQSLGMRLISLTSSRKNDDIRQLLLRDNIDFIWTSGSRSSAERAFAWGDGSRVHGYTNWSHTGGNGRPQPDNREGHENCLAFMNNIYQDGVRWHDIACHHKKQFVCERFI